MTAARVLQHAEGCAVLLYGRAKERAPTVSPNTATPAPDLLTFNLVGRVPPPINYRTQLEPTFTADTCKLCCSCNCYAYVPTLSRLSG